MTNETPPESDGFYWRPWIEVVAFWVVLGSVAVYYFAPLQAGELLPRFLGLTSLGLIDLFTTGGLLRVVISIAAGREKNGLGAAIRASSWGTIKLVSVGLLTVTIWRSRGSPPLPLILGLTTLVVVPIIGGIRWHLLNLRNQRFRKVVVHAR